MVLPRNRVHDRLQSQHVVDGLAPVGIDLPDVRHLVEGPAVAGHRLPDGCHVARDGGRGGDGLPQSGKGLGGRRHLFRDAVDAGKDRTFAGIEGTCERVEPVTHVRREFLARGVLRVDELPEQHGRLVRSGALLPPPFDRVPHALGDRTLGAGEGVDPLREGGFRAGDDPFHGGLVIVEKDGEGGGIHRRFGFVPPALAALEFPGDAAGLGIIGCHRRLLTFLRTMPEAG